MRVIVETIENMLEKRINTLKKNSNSEMVKTVYSTACESEIKVKITPRKITITSAYG